MKEDFLHFIWKFQLFNSLDLKTTENENISIINCGFHNLNSGPDFSGAQIKIGDKIWNGNIEIHTKSSAWYQHNHQSDDAYKNVILHVVYENDRDVFLNVKGDLPVLELKNCIDSKYQDRYESLMKSRGWIPCESQFPDLSDLKVNQWIDRTVISRMQRKSSDVLRIYFECNKDWNEAFYRWIGRSFGFKINSEAFEILTKSTPLKLLKKHGNSLKQIEALLYGQAGFLKEESTDRYKTELRNEYLFLKTKYNLKSMNSAAWKFSRTHPSNFPTKRIAQFAAFIFEEKSTFSKFLEILDIAEIRKLLSSKTSDYWVNRYNFTEDEKVKLSGKMGDSSIDGLIINGICTILFTYGKKQEAFDLVERGVSFLEKLAPEKNGIITKWKGLGLAVSHSKHTQGLIELKNEFCEKKKCLSCLFGSEILKLETNDSYDPQHI